MKWNEIVNEYYGDSGNDMYEREMDELINKTFKKYRKVDQFDDKEEYKQLKKIESTSKNPKYLFKSRSGNTWAKQLNNNTIFAVSKRGVNASGAFYIKEN